MFTYKERMRAQIWES